MKTEKIPTLVVTSDKWSSDPYVVFEGEEFEDIIQPEWIEERFDKIQEEHDWSRHGADEGEDITREQVVSEMRADFVRDNSAVDEFWPEYGILRTTDGYYCKYDDYGQAVYIEEEEALEKMPEVREEKIREWRDEQKQIEASEKITPRQAGVMDRFGIDEVERGKLADDTTVLRKYQGRLYVYESQLGEPVQWRLLQPRPHMPTGTLPRPSGSID